MAKDNTTDGKAEIDAKAALKDGETVIEGKARRAAKDKSAKAKPVKTKPIKVKGERKGVSFKLAASMSILAALGGALLGGVVPRIIDPSNAAPADSIARNEARLNQIKSDLSAQGDTLSGVQTNLADANNTLGNVSRLTSRLTVLEQAEQARAAIDLTAEREAALAPIAAKIDVLETLLQGEDVPEGAAGAASELLSRLDALEEQIATLKLTAALSGETSILTYRDAGSKPSSDTQSGRDAISDADTKPGAKKSSYDLAANFPRAEMLEALAAQARNAEDPSWIRKLFERHVEVRDSDGINPKAVIADAQAKTNAGDIEGAIAAIETLNPTLRAAAHTWLLEAKKTL